MSIHWRARNDLILPPSESSQNQFQNQRWSSDNRQMPTARQNTQYVIINTARSLSLSTLCYRSIMDPVVRSGVSSNSSRKSKQQFVCSGSKQSGNNKCSRTWRDRFDAIENCENSHRCSHIGKLKEKGEIKFIILEAVQNGYFVDSPGLIVRTLESHKNQRNNRLKRQK